MGLMLSFSFIAGALALPRENIAIENLEAGTICMFPLMLYFTGKLNN
jgi:hypothetical protein